MVNNVHIELRQYYSLEFYNDYHSDTKMDNKTLI